MTRMRQIQARFDGNNRVSSVNITGVSCEWPSVPVSAGLLAQFTLAKAGYGVWV